MAPRQKTELEEIVPLREYGDGDKQDELNDEEDDCGLDEWEDEYYYDDEEDEDPWDDGA